MSERIIKIPSKNLYTKENQKVVDNIIERIEVVAKDVLPNNEYEVAIHNETVKVENPISKGQGASDWQYGLSVYEDAISYKLSYGVACVHYRDIKTASFSIQFSNLYNNKSVTAMYSGVDKDGNPRIKYTLYGRTIKGYAENGYSGTISSTMNKDTISVSPEGSLTLTPITENNVEREIVIPSEETIECKITQVGTNGKPLTVTATAKEKLYGTLGEAVIEDIDDTTHKVSFSDMVVGCKVVATTDGRYNVSAGDISGTMSGQYTEFIVDRVEFTIYGNTVGIELKDKTVYINGDTAKKVYSVESNELMQTSNYYLSNGVKMPSIELLYESTNALYKKGKETATIRCSISDYFDYLTNKKVISTDGTTNKMAFSLYDKVVPMVRNWQGIDVPMSLTKAGNAKSFSVLGTKIFYDGAVWQELYLQESRDDSPISKPTISIDGDILRIFSLDDRVSSFEVYIDDVLNTTVQYLGKETTVDLSKLNLSSKVHKIAVKAKASGYDDSELSDAKHYGAGTKQLKHPSLYLSGDILQIKDEDGRAEEYYIYDGGLIISKIPKTGEYTTLNLTALELEIGYHHIRAKATSPYYVDSPESKEVVYYSQGEVVLPMPDGSDTEENNENGTIITISGLWYFIDNPDIDWLRRVLRYGGAGRYTQFTVYTAPPEDQEDFENLDNWSMKTMIFTETGISMDDGYVCVENGFTQERYRYIYFEGEQYIGYGLANWIVGNTEGGTSNISLMSTRTRTTFPKGSLRYI